LLNNSVVIYIYAEWVTEQSRTSYLTFLAGPGQERFTTGHSPWRKRMRLIKAFAEKRSGVPEQGCVCRSPQPLQAKWWSGLS